MIQQVLNEPGWLSRMKVEDFRALTPLIYAHVNPYGIFELDMDTRLPLEMTGKASPIWHTQLILGQLKINTKGNEITAISVLIQIRLAIETIDAMVSQKPRLS